MKWIYLLILPLIPFISQGQIEWDFSTLNTGKVTPTEFDPNTENTVIYENDEAEIYLRLSDLRVYFQEKGLPDSITSKILLASEYDTDGKKCMKFVDIHSKDNLGSFQDRTIKATISFSLEYASIDLISQEKFMVYDKKNQKFASRVRIKKKRRNGNSYLEFLLPTREVFLREPIRFQEMIWR